MEVSVGALFSQYSDGKRDERSLASRPRLGPLSVIVGAALMTYFSLFETPRKPEQKKIKNQVAGCLMIHEAINIL
jgi:hypothetical protein